jgi:Flp pilus assembly pilin Flp
LLLEACRSWRVRRKRKEVNQVLKLFNYAYSLPRKEDGQTMAEYGVVLAVITIGVVFTLGFLADDIVTALDSVRSHL